MFEFKPRLAKGSERVFSLNIGNKLESLLTDKSVDVVPTGFIDIAAPSSPSVKKRKLTLNKTTISNLGRLGNTPVDKPTFDIKCLATEPDPCQTNFEYSCRCPESWAHDTFCCPTKEQDCNIHSLYLAIGSVGPCDGTLYNANSCPCFMTAHQASCICLPGDDLNVALNTVPAISCEYCYGTDTTVDTGNG